MRRTNHVGALLAVTVLLLGMAVPGMAAAGIDDQPAPAYQQSAPTSNNSTVQASLGQQLSTVIAATSDDVQTEVEESAFEAELDSDDESGKATAIAKRVDNLQSRAQNLRDEYQTATDAYERGNLSASAYAQRLAVLHVRAENVLKSLDRLQDRTEEVSKFELQAAGVTQSGLRAIETDLESLAGAGPSALLRQFDGRSSGESTVEIDAENGLEISVESDDGEHSREFKKPDDGNDTITVSQIAALATARGSLSDRSWSLTKASVKHNQGYYTFTFTFSSENVTGEAKVRVDGSSDAVIRLEEETERREADNGESDESDDESDGGSESNGESEDDEDEGESNGDVVLLLADGTPGPNETVTVAATAGGQPVANTTVTMNGEVVGTTDANGTLTLTLPAGETELVLEGNDAELEFEFEDGDEDDLSGDIQATGTIDNGTTTVQVTYDGSGVAGATVFGESGMLGTTDANGRLTFTTAATEKLELNVVKGEFGADLTLRVDGSSLSLTKAEVGDDDKEEDDEGEEEEGKEDDNEDDNEGKDTGKDDDDEKEGDDEASEETEEPEDSENTEKPDDSGEREDDSEDT